MQTISRERVLRAVIATAVDINLMQITNSTEVRQQAAGRAVDNLIVLALALDAPVSGESIRPLNASPLSS